MTEVLYYVAAAVLGLVIWLIRLDSRASQNTKDILDVHMQLQQHLTKDDDIHSKVMETLTEIREDIGEIKGLVRNRRPNDRTE